MEHLVLWSAGLVGPCYGAILIGLIVARRLFPTVQFLDDLSEWLLLFFASIAAIAVAGIVVQLT